MWKKVNGILATAVFIMAVFTACCVEKASNTEIITDYIIIAVIGGVWWISEAYRRAFE